MLGQKIQPWWMIDINIREPMAMIILQIKVPRDSSLPINRGAKQETKWAKLRRKCREREREREEEEEDEKEFWVERSVGLSYEVTKKEEQEGREKKTKRKKNPKCKEKL